MNFTLFFSLYLLIFLINIIAFNCFYTENESIEKLKKDEKNEVRQTKYKSKYYEVLFLFRI